MVALRVAARVPSTSAEGPGRRYALWVQGCSIRCPGCCNPHLFESAGGAIWSVEDLAEDILGTPDIEGITVLGGEPFDQSSGLAALAEGVRRAGLSVIVFTGFTLAELRGQPVPSVGAALLAIDVLVDGRYEAAQPESARLWAGSRNQRFHYLTKRYSPAIEIGEGPAETVALEIRPDGTTVSHGWPIWPVRS